jgi:hypothetical protein
VRKEIYCRFTINRLSDHTTGWLLDLGGFLFFLLLLYLLACSITLYLVILHAIYIEFTVVIFTLIVYSGYVLHGFLLVFTIQIVVYVCWYFHWLFFLCSVLSSFILSTVFVNLRGLFCVMLFGVRFPGGSILGLLLLCHLAVGEGCGPATPHSPNSLYRIFNLSMSSCSLECWRSQKFLS